MNIVAQRLSIYEPTDLVHSRSGGAGTANFDGFEPETAVFTAPSRIEWTTNSTSAGLIDPVALGCPASYRILRVVLLMAGQSTFNVDLLDGTSVINLVTGTTATTSISEGLGFLMDGQKLRVTTTGAGTTSVKMIVTLAHVSAVQPAAK